MPKYVVVGTGAKTGRKRKRIFSAHNEESARKIAELAGTTVESISELEPDPPTERQLSFAYDLGIVVPEGATKADVSDLLDVRLSDDKPAEERYLAFARFFRVQSTKYVGKKRLFDLIQAAISARGRETDLMAWFVFRVFRDLVRDTKNPTIYSPNHPIIQKIAKSIADNKKFVESARRYNGSDLIFFGKVTFPNGDIKTGGNKQTLAYKEAVTRLLERDDLALPKEHIEKEMVQKSPQPKVVVNVNLDEYKAWVNVFKKEKMKIREFDLYGTRAALAWNSGDTEITVICVTAFRNQQPITAKYDHFEFNVNEKYWLGTTPKGSPTRIREELKTIGLI